MPKALKMLYLMKIIYKPLCSLVSFRLANQHIIIFITSIFHIHFWQDQRADNNNAFIKT